MKGIYDLEFQKKIESFLNVGLRCKWRKYLGDSIICRQPPNFKKKNISILGRNHLTTVPSRFCPVRLVSSALNIYCAHKHTVVCMKQCNNNIHSIYAIYIYTYNLIVTHKYICPTYFCCNNGDSSPQVWFEHVHMIEAATKKVAPLFSSKTLDVPHLLKSSTLQHKETGVVGGGQRNLCVLWVVYTTESNIDTKNGHMLSRRPKSTFSKPESFWVSMLVFGDVYGSLLDEDLYWYIIHLLEIIQLSIICENIIVLHRNISIILTDNSLPKPKLHKLDMRLSLKSQPEVIYGRCFRNPAKTSWYLDKIPIFPQGFFHVIMYIIISHVTSQQLAGTIRNYLSWNKKIREGSETETFLRLELLGPFTRENGHFSAHKCLLRLITKAPVCHKHSFKFKGYCWVKQDGTTTVAQSKIRLIDSNFQTPPFHIHLPLLIPWKLKKARPWKVTPKPNRKGACFRFPPWDFQGKITRCEKLQGLVQPWRQLTCY